jgi:hypothetical protein
LSLDETLTYVLIVSGVVIACLIVIYAMRRRGRKDEKPPEEEKKMELTGLPFKIVKSVSQEETARARKELGILDLEREILSDAIRRLYEAHADGRVTEEERERLARTYKSRMIVVKEAISKDESLVALHELEAMQEDLMKLFSERFDEVSTKVEELRSRVDVKPIREITVPSAEAIATAETPAAEAKTKRRRKRAPVRPSRKAEAEKRIEKIRAEVEKVLDKLGQMEVET